MIKKRAVTLVELLLVVAILALTTAVVGVNIQRAVKEQRFLNDVARLTELLNRAQELMLIADAEVRVQLSKEAYGVHVLLKTEEALPKAWEKLVEKELTLSNLTLANVENKVLNLDFLSRGSVMTRGIIALKGQEERYIALQGYPHPITAVREVPLLVEEDLTPYVQQIVEELNS